MYTITKESTDSPHSETDRLNRQIRTEMCIIPDLTIKQQSEQLNIKLTVFASD